MPHLSELHSGAGAPLHPCQLNIPANSCHPKHVRKTLPNSHFTRIRLNCSTLNSYDREACAMEDRLFKHGYHRCTIKQAHLKPGNTNMKDLLVEFKPRVNQNLSNHRS